MPGDDAEKPAKARKPRTLKADEDRLLRKWVGLHPSLWAKIEDFRFELRLGSEARAVRELVISGLAVFLGESNPKPPSHTRIRFPSFRKAGMDEPTKAAYNEAVLTDFADLYQYHDGRMKMCRHMPSDLCDRMACAKGGCHRANALLNNYLIGDEDAVEHDMTTVERPKRARS